MTEAGQNWVLARANCTLQDSFDAIKNAVDLDVKRFNQLAPDKRRDLQFRVERKDLSIVVSRARPAVGHPGQLVSTDMDDVICVRKEAACIWASRESCWSIEICPEWNDETLTCDLLIDGKSCTPSQISQRLLGDFFFGV